MIIRDRLNGIAERLKRALHTSSLNKQHKHIQASLDQVGVALGDLQDIALRLTRWSQALRVRGVDRAWPALEPVVRRLEGLAHDLDPHAPDVEPPPVSSFDGCLHLLPLPGPGEVVAAEGAEGAWEELTVGEKLKREGTTVQFEAIAEDGATAWLDLADEGILWRRERRDRYMRNDCPVYDSFQAIARMAADGAGDWEYPGQVVRDVRRLAGDRDHARAKLSEVMAVLDTLGKHAGVVGEVRPEKIEEVVIKEIAALRRAAAKGRSPEVLTEVVAKSPGAKSWFAHIHEMPPSLGPSTRWPGAPEGQGYSKHEPPPKPSPHPAIYDLIRKDLDERDHYGKKKYGTRLHPFNGRRALVDAYQEFLDLLVYFRQELYEREVLETHIRGMLLGPSTRWPAALDAIAEAFPWLLEGGE